MKKGRLLGYLIMLIGLLAGGYFILRPHYRLPFDKVSVLAAVEESAEMLLKLSARGLLAKDHYQDHLWRKDAQLLISLLDTLNLDQDIQWEEWWLLPQSGEDLQDISFTFIGSSAEIGKNWNPVEYGPTLPFGQGQIYTHNISTANPFYFARYHNLLIVSRFPFQVENALLAAQDEVNAWAENEELQTLLASFIAEKDWYGIFRNNSEHPTAIQQWLGYSTTQQENISWDWACVAVEAKDSLAFAEIGYVSNASISTNATAVAWNYLPPNVQTAYPLATQPVGNTSGNDGDNVFMPWLGDGAWVLRTLQPASDTKVDPKVWALPIADSNSYQAFKKSNQQQLNVIDRTTYQLFDLQQWQDAGPFTSLSGRKLWQPWSCELPDLLLLSIYREDLEEYLDYYLLGAGLNQTTEFAQLRQALASSSTADWQAYQSWQSTKENDSNILQLLYPKAAWAKQGVMLAQAQIGSDGITRVEAVFKKADERAGTSIDWSVALPTAESLRLIRVENKDQQIIGLLAQNTNGQLWAYDLFGHELWQSRVEGELFNPVMAIDYSSGVQHWIAASPTDLFMWDDNGADQANLSFKGVLPAAAPTRFLFPAIDQPLIAFPNKDNKLILQYLNSSNPDGWPIELKEKVTEPLMHINQAREDLVIAFRQNSGWNVVNSKGEPVFSADTSSLSRRSRVGEVYKSQSNPLGEADRLIVAHSDGTLTSSSLTGEEFSLRLGRGPIDNIVQTNCWGDARPDYVVQRGSLVHLFAYEDNQFTERWQYRLPLAPDRIIAAPPLGVLAVSDSEKKVWLISDEGKLLNGFPVAGEGEVFLAGSEERGFRILTATDRKLYAYYLSVPEL